MRMSVVFLGGAFVLLLVASAVATLASDALAKKRSMSIPKPFGLIAIFIFSALLGWGASWACGFLLKSSSLPPFSRVVAITLTWFATTVAVTILAALAFSKSAPRGTVIICAPWICCFTVLLGAFSIPMARSLYALDAKLTCMSHLRQVHLALKLYAEDHDGALPKRVEEILDPYLAGCKQILSCPAGKHADSYGYDPTVFVEPSGILMWDRRGNHRGGRNVLYSNGEVKWVSEEEFNRVAADRQD